MAPKNLTHYAAQAVTFPKRVWFIGNGALEKGVGVCYQFDYGTATVKEGARNKRVEVPDTSNNRFFAGVTARSYLAKTGGQWIEILEPGSTCEVAVGLNTVIGTTLLTCSVSASDAGRFSRAGFPGRGSMIAMETDAAAVVASELVGAAAMDATGLILTGTVGDFVTGAVAAGDRVIIFSGETDVTNTTTVGEYEVASVTSATELVLTAAVADGGTMQVSFYIIRENPRVLAYLMDGEESGLQECIDPILAAASQSMVGGFTYIGGGYTVATSDSLATLANGTRYGERKGFQLLGALGTNDWLLTVTSGLQSDGSTALASAEFDAAADLLIVEWVGIWLELYARGVTEAST